MVRVRWKGAELGEVRMSRSEESGISIFSTHGKSCSSTWQSHFRLVDEFRVKLKAKVFRKACHKHGRNKGSRLDRGSCEMKMVLSCSAM